MIEPRKFKMFTEAQLAGLLCVLNDIAIKDTDGSENWWLFAGQARLMLAAVSTASPEGATPSDPAPLLVDLETFMEAVKRNPTARGVPVYYAVWPTDDRHLPQKGE